MLLEYCSKCGLKVTDAEMASGALRIADDNYLCPTCAKSSGLRKAAPAMPMPRPKTNRPVSGPNVSRTRQQPGTAVAPASGSALPIVAAIVGIAVLGVGVWLALKKDPDPARPSAINAPPPVQPTPPQPAPPVQPTAPDTAKVNTPEIPTVDLTKKKEPAADPNYDPRGAHAMKTLVEINAWFKSHPDDPDEYASKLNELKNRYGRTPAAEEATKLLGSLKVEPSAPAESVPPDGEWKNAIDLLKALDPSLDSVRGIWTRAGAALVSDGGLKSKSAMLALPYEPPAEYDLRITGVRKSGKDTLGLRIPRGDRGVSFALSGWGGEIHGFERIKGNRGKEGPAHSEQAGLIENGREFSLVLQVRRKTIKAYIDGKFLVACDQPRADLSVFDRDWGIRYPRRLGLGSWESSYEIKRIDVLERNGKGRQIPAAGRQNELQMGLWASFWQGTGETDHFKHLRFARDERTMNWNVGYGKVDPDMDVDFFDTRYCGILRVPAAGRYKFILNADDNMLLMLDGKEIGRTERYGLDFVCEIDLSTGDHDFRAEQWENLGGASMHLMWQPPGKEREDIPVEYLFYDPTKTEIYDKPRE